MDYTPEQLLEEAFREFEGWFIKNYPGPETIISDPAWHAPRIFRSATHRLDKAHAAKIEECERLKRVLRELLETTLSQMPPHEAGKDAQDAWADRRAKARNGAAAMLAALKEPK